MAKICGISKITSPSGKFNIGAMCRGAPRPKSVYGHKWRFATEAEITNG